MPVVQQGSQPDLEGGDGCFSCVTQSARCIQDGRNCGMQRGLWDDSGRPWDICCCCRRVRSGHVCLEFFCGGKGLGEFIHRRFQEPRRLHPDGKQHLHQTGAQGSGVDGDLILFAGDAGPNTQTVERHNVGPWAPYLRIKTHSEHYLPSIFAERNFT